MPKKISEIEGVWRFISGSSKDDFYYVNSDKHLCHWRDNKSIKIIDSFNCEIVEPWSGGFLINENKFFIDDTVEQLFDGEVYSKSIINQELLLIKKLDFVNEKVEYGIFNKTNYHINRINTPSNTHPLLYLNDDKIISHSDSDIYCHSINGNLIWNQPFKALINSSIGTITKPIIDIDGSYFIGLGENKSDHLFQIDLDSGECDELQYFQFEFFYNKQENILSTEHQNNLLNLNLRTKKKESWDVDALIKSNGFDSIHDHRCQCDKNSFYFTQTLGDDKAKIGCLDTVLKKLTFSHEFLPDNGGVSTIEQDENYIFVCTQDNTLHIFEK